MQTGKDWAERLLQYERVSPKGERLYILFLQQYNEVKHAGWQQGQDFMDGRSLLPTECGGHRFFRPDLIRNL